MTIYQCPLTGWIVTPINVTDCGYGIESWVCCACDGSGHTRQDAEYSPAYPGCHYRLLVPQTPPRVWPLNKWRKAA